MTILKSHAMKITALSLCVLIAILVCFQFNAHSDEIDETNPELTLEEIEAEVKADPNPLPPLSVELALAVLLPFAVIFLIVHLIRRALHKTGRHKKSRVPRPRNRYFR